MAHNKKIDDFSSIAAVVDGTQFETDTGGITANKASGLQIRTYILLNRAIGTDIQAFDEVLDDLSALTAVADNEVIVGTGAGTYTHESGATLQTSLGLLIGTDVQAWSAVLDATTASFLTADETKLDGIEALADVTDTANVTSAGALMDSEVDADLKTFSLPSSTTISAFGATLIDDAAASNARTTLELVIGTDVQAEDEVLTDLAALSAVADNEFVVGDGAGSYAHESGATARTSMGVAIGVDVQAFDADTAKLDVAQEYTRQQGFNETTLTALGADLVTNGGFAADTDWTKGTGWTIATGVANSDATQSADSDLTQALSLVNTNTYEVEFKVTNYVAGNVTPVAGDTEGTDRAANGTFTENIVAGAGGDIDIRGDLDFDGDIDDVTVRLANVSWDLNSNQVTELTLDGNMVLDNPTNQQAGTTYILRLIQDGVGSRTITFGSAYRFSGGTAPTLSTGVNSVDYITFVSDGTNMDGVFKGDFS